MPEMDIWSFAEETLDTVEQLAIVDFDEQAVQVMAERHPTAIFFFARLTME